jgi:hypothetical protein
VGRESRQNNDPASRDPLVSPLPKGLIIGWHERVDEDHRVRALVQHAAHEPVELIGLSGSAFGTHGGCGAVQRHSPGAISRTTLVVPARKCGSDLCLIHPVHADQFLARARPANYRDVRRSDSEVLCHEATERLVRATLVGRRGHTSHDPTVLQLT